jgi:hypothetical protein
LGASIYRIFPFGTANATFPTSTVSQKTAGGKSMKIAVKASDLNYKYKKDTVNRDLPKFTGKPDPAPFNRDDLYDLLPMLSAVMSELGTDDDRVLHMLEDIIIRDMPRCISSREDVFDCLVATAREQLEWM